MSVPQHEARSKFLTEHINQGMTMLMRTLADATQALDEAIDHEDDAIALRREGDAVGAARAMAMHASAMRKHADAHSWADRLGEQIGEALLRLALGHDQC